MSVHTDDFNFTTFLSTTFLKIHYANTLDDFKKCTINVLAKNT